MNSGAIKSELDWYLYNPPRPYSSYVNNSFVDRISKAEQNLGNLVSESDRANSESQRAYGDYDTFTGNMRGYHDFYNEAEDEFGVTQAKDAYEQSKRALSMTQSMLDALPSSISANSARRLTIEQRNLRYNAQANTINSVQNKLQYGAAQYEQAWKNARENQAAKAAALTSEQNVQQQQYAERWKTALDIYHQKRQNARSAQSELAQERSAYLDWQAKQAEQAWQEWQTKVDALQTRYKQARATELAQKQLDREHEQRVSDYERKSALADSLIRDFQARNYGTTRAW